MAGLRYGALGPCFEPRLLRGAALDEESAGSGGDSSEPKRTPERVEVTMSLLAFGRAECWPCVTTSPVTSSISDEPSPSRVCQNPHMLTLLIAAAFFAGLSGIIKLHDRTHQFPA
jgi:hypothetical protein